LQWVKLGVIFYPCGCINDLHIHYFPSTVGGNISGRYFQSAVAIFIPHSIGSTKNYKFVI